MKFNKKHFENLILVHVLIFTLVSGVIRSQTRSDQSAGETSIEILSACLTHESLWGQLPMNSRNIDTYYILDHGTTINISQDLKINGKPVSLIQKNYLPHISNSPYFIFHTLNIEQSKALVRLYLICNIDGNEKIVTSVFSFIKENNHWKLTKKPL